MDSNNLVYDVIIIGGGASGLMCASYLFALNSNAKILVLERNEKIGTKIYITGNGRCNLTNKSITFVDYSTDNYDRLKTILNSYSVNRTINYFEENLGVHVTYKDDLVYPFSNKSSTVVDAFKMNLEGNIDIILNSFVKSTKKIDDLFEVVSNDCCYKAKNIVFAGGGSAAPKTGSDGNIYKLILPYSKKTDFTQVTPSLVQLKTLETDSHKLSGTRVKAELTLKSGSANVASTSGELMFTDYGVSGICVFDISGYYYHEMCKNSKNLKLYANLMPGEDIEEILKKRVSLFPDRSITDILSGFFTKDLSSVIVSRSNGSLESFISVIREFEFSVSGTLGFDNAQVTGGGLNLSALDDSCKLTEGVYVIGEAVNVDGPCGGYNLQWAWSSGMAAAKNISEGLDK